ncbi:hypothetical protein M6D93_07085 [Jatrophihabitans telluris]|uniref:Linalool dehydratase/isomerase domain-containing protein n=1 Tax=Jatrophihabitans telluris TaxID=2038343 RepID=A0ABY4R345_9ACTN|nr:hypothetical protein [Jatrophihabitans telluris]UQX89757.1 hypothetical protein M6D93_07085 [Jatrophihabitans telluris]
MSSEPTGPAGPAVARPRLTASVPCLAPPPWATSQRALFELLDQGWRRFSEAYCNPDGSLRYEQELSSRDGADDFMEAFFNWPQLYLLGGADDLLPAAARHWHGVAGQLTRLGMYRDEFEIGYDWFHQGESLLFFYFLTMADPQAWQQRAARFADLYLDPACGNYDPERRIIKAPHNGSGGAREGVSDSPSYPWTEAEAAQYGYPLDWLIDPMAPVPPLAEDPRLGEQMQQRLGRGDAVGNLSVAGLVLNAFLATGEHRFADWLGEYVGAWKKRAEANDGLIPDNVGLDGVVGSQLEGRWYGGHYGWSWPHGMYSLAQAALVGAMSAALARRDDSFLDMPRALLDAVIAQGRQGRFADSDSSIAPRWRAHLGDAIDTDTLLVPYRHSDKGWFDYNPVQASVPLALWHHSDDAADRARLDGLRAASGYDWASVRPFRDKEEAGHEEPWYAYLAGDNPDYPEQILAAAQIQARRRLALLETHAGRELAEADIHLWQNVNPVVTEALVQLTWGGPQVVYNGGTQQARVRYFDRSANGGVRPGLPQDVAALVSSIEPLATTVTLINLSGTQARALTVQAGALAEHEITTVTATHSCAEWTGRDSEYLPHEPVVQSSDVDVAGPWLDVDLPPGTQITLRLAMRLRAYPPSYRSPA